jgi:hypothetical protein
LNSGKTGGLLAERRRRPRSSVIFVQRTVAILLALNHLVAPILLPAARLDPRMLET